MNPKVQILNLEVNQGKGNALKQGVLASGQADYYYLADADLSAGWETLDQLLTAQGTANAVIGSRAVVTSKVATVWYRKLLGRLSAFLIQLVLGLGIKDTQCGYKLFDNSLFKLINLVQESRWSFDFELLYIYKLAGLTVKEYGIKWQNMPGSKVKFFDYFKQLPALVKIRLRHNVRKIQSVLA
jgi:dolichyl-phosphate beta-glucosyltransferase